MKSVRALVAALLLAVPLAACGDGKSSAPAMEEAMVDQATLAKFVALLPAAPKGFTAAPATTVTGKERSVVAQTYSAPTTDSFSVEITFSNADVAKFQKMLDEPKEANKAAAEINQIAGRNALSFSSPVVTNAKYLMIVSPSRYVTVTPLFGDTLKPIMRSVFEQIDFDAIAAQK
ncbi:hypothetical protein sos41_13450 [Alphaproteobacteria bacterium SO-S41]|nr:hypothetical protein sos41_13450 [Alphaproteobacteria bacterium SO-S41]